ncbi:MAG: YitT family protein [Chitinophagaceae bacterium]|nr:YitT family protein [Chitinophagaceae bacterium]
MSQNADHIHWKDIFNIKHAFLNISGVALITFALKGFMIPNKFLDGGITGVSILIHEITHWPFGVLILLLNIPFVILGRRILGKTFAIQSSITLILLAITMTFIHVDAVTSDPLLTALFGGCLIGVGMGLCIRGGSAADGAEILAVLTTRKIGLNISEVIFAMNTLLFLAAIYSFGISTALYSIVTYFAAVKSLDYIADGIEQYTSLHIISARSEEIKALIVQKFGKGITVIKGERGYLPNSFHIKSDCDIIVTIVTRLELLRIKESISSLDPHAFMYIQYIKEASGGILSLKKKH